MRKVLAVLQRLEVVELQLSVQMALPLHIQGSKILSKMSEKTKQKNFHYVFRGLAIGGPGSKIYAIPKSIDLERLALTHKDRDLDSEGVLVARGPAIFYNKDISE
jgi:hypothetical protein